MLLTPHVLVGLAIAKLVPNPLISVPLSILAHFLGDLVPHWDFFSGAQSEQRLKGWRPIAVMMDFGLGIAVGLFFTLNLLWVKQSESAALNAFLCGIASVLPDALEAPHVYMDKTPFGTKYLLSIQRKFQTQAPVVIGILTQVLISALSLVFLFS